MPDPILSLDSLEPQRPTVAVTHPVPATAWDAWKARHLRFLLRWLPVRYERRRNLYALHVPSEFGLRTIARIQNAQHEFAELQSKHDDPAAIERAGALLREVSGLILDAPDDVLDSLTTTQHLTLQMAFPAAVMGLMPTAPSGPPENPSTLGDSSPASAVSIPATNGTTG